MHVEILLLEELPLNEVYPRDDHTFHLGLQKSAGLQQEIRSGRLVQEGPWFEFHLFADGFEFVALILTSEGGHGAEGFVIEALVDFEYGLSRTREHTLQFGFFRDCLHVEVHQQRSVLLDEGQVVEVLDFFRFSIVGAA